LIASLDRTHAVMMSSAHLAEKHGLDEDGEKATFEASSLKCRHIHQRSGNLLRDYEFLGPITEIKLHPLRRQADGHDFLLCTVARVDDKTITPDCIAGFHPYDGEDQREASIRCDITGYAGD
jgi:hypothetical protein